MRGWLTAIAAVGLASSAFAQTTPQGEHPLLRELMADVHQERLQHTITRLVAFGTRHTASETSSPRRGIGAARRWTQAQFGAISRACHSCLTIATPSDVVSGERMATPTQIVDVIAVQPGQTDPNRVIIISAHVDSRVTDVTNATSDAPGADDDGSGVAAVLEAARVLSKHHFAATIVYAVLSGEEQGLYGGKILADYARAQNWRVEADLNNDIMGGTHGEEGIVDSTHVRVFSEGTRSTETPDEAARRRYNGGEVDSASRNIARFMDALADRYFTGFDVRMVYRTDRYSRGGDQVRMLEAGFPAVRITEAAENYTRQHQDVRTENGIAYGDTIDGVDFPYLAQVTRLNILTLAALASAPAPPSEVTVSGAVSADTTLHWARAAGGASYRVWWRETTAPQWQYDRGVGDVAETTLRGVVIDDWFFGVSAVSADGYESPVVFPGSAGAYFPG